MFHLMASMLALVSDPTAADLTSEAAIGYRDCIRDFAVAQLSSGESAEALTSAGVAECFAFVPEIRRLVRNEMMEDTDIQNAYRRFPRIEVDTILNEAVNNTVNSIRSMARDSALRDVIVIKSEMNDRQGNSAPN